MFEKLYTTKMSASKKQLQGRFAKIRSKSGRVSKIMSAVMSGVLVLTLLCATVTMAAVGNEEQNFFVNGKGYAIEPILVENSLATHTDNYYVPLRKTFEALGYKVSYDVDKSDYEHLMDRVYSFPSYDTSVHIERKFDDGSTFIDEYNSFSWQKELVTNSVDYYIYGATFSLNRQMPIIEMTKDGKTEFCQIGSREYSTGYALAPVLMGSSAYIPLRAVASMVGGSGNVKWDNIKHDTYFEGVLTFDEVSSTIVIETK